MLRSPALKSLNSKSGAFAIYVIALMFLTVEWTFFRLEVLADHPSVIVTFVKGVSDFVIILLPFFFLKPKYRWTLFLPLLLLSLYFLANVLYFRVFEQLIPFKSLFYFKNFDKTLIESTFVLFKPSDLVYIICPLLYLLVALFIRNTIGYKVIFGRKIKVCATVISLSYFLLIHIYSFFRGIYIRDNYGVYTSITEQFKDKYFDLVPTSNNIKHDTGLVSYLFLSVLREFNSPSMIDKYSADEAAAISNFINTRSNSFIYPDSVFTSNKDKNLILIIVESLNSEFIGKSIKGVELTPNINRLLKSPSVISALNVISQVGDGWSSDGQMLYNAGLLPLKSGVAAMNCDRNVYISLADILGKRTSVDFICESVSFWNHETTSRQYGFDKLYSISEQKDSISLYGYDKTVFDFAARKLAQLPKPFYAEITTLSMHYPFTDTGSYRNDSLLVNSGYPKIISKYLNALKYFDEQLGTFLNQLQQSGLLSESVVIIAADHNIVFSKFTDEKVLQDQIPRIPFIALNTGATINLDKTVGQCDIFPTILDIMGVSQNATWRGVGQSMFNPLTSGAMAKDGSFYGSSDSNLMRDAYRVSDLILRGHGTKPILRVNESVLLLNRQRF